MGIEFPEISTRRFGWTRHSAEPPTSQAPKDEIMESNDYHHDYR